MSVDPTESAEAVPRGPIVERSGEVSRAFRNWLERGIRQTGKVISGIATLNSAVQVIQGQITEIDGSLSTYYGISVDGGGNGAILRISDGASFGSAISMGADEVTLDAGAINFGSQTRFDTATETVITTTGSIRTRYGAPFGVSGTVLRWYGPTSVPEGSETRTNGYFAEGTDGLPYYGTAPLNWGATAAEAAASNVRAPIGGNRLLHTEFSKVTGYWSGVGTTGSAASLTKETTSSVNALRYSRDGMTAGQIFYIHSNPQRTFFSVKPGEIVFAAAYIAGSSGCSAIGISIIWRNDAGSLVSATPVTSTSSSISYPIENLSIRLSVIGVAPAGATNAEIRCQGTASGGNAIIKMARPQMCLVSDANASAPKYVPGSEADWGADITIDNTAGDIISGLIQNSQVSQTAGALTLSNNTWTTVASFSFTSVGIGVELRGTCEILSQKSASGGSLGALEWQLLRGSTVLKGPIDTKAPITDVAGLGTAVNKVAAIVADYNDVPSSGTYTYALQCRINVTDGAVPELTTRQVSNRYLSAREFRR